MENLQYLIVKRCANIAIGPSSLRRMYEGKNKIVQIRNVFINIPPKTYKFLLKSKNGIEELKADLFLKLSATNIFKKNYEYGPIQKCICLFLRELAYNKFFFDYCEGKILYDKLDLPFDSHCAVGLINLLKKNNFEVNFEVQRIINLTPDNFLTFQDQALEISRLLGTQRVHLDLHFWRSTN